MVPRVLHRESSPVGTPSLHLKMLSNVLLGLFVFCAPLWPQSAPDVSSAFEQATANMRQGNLQAAAEGFTTVVKKNPAFAEAHFNLGLVYEELGKPADAIASLHQALTLKPRMHGANLFLGIAEYRLNHLDQSLAALKKETTNFPKDPSAWMWFGVVELARDQPEAAAEALDKAAKLAPNDTDILYHRGQAHLLVSKNSYALMFKADPKSWRVRQILAQANADAERHVDAIAEYQEAIKLAPRQPGLHEELGTEYRNIGKLDEAQAAFQQELEIDPYNVLARYKLGVLLVEKGQAAQGKEMIEAAARDKAGLRHLDYNLGRAEMLLGDDNAAAEHLKRATTAPADPEVMEQTWYQLGMVYRRLHRTGEAQQAMATFQKLKDEEAEASQKKLKKFEAQQSQDAIQPSTPSP